MSHTTIQLLIKSGLSLEKAREIAGELDRYAVVAPRLAVRPVVSETARAAAQERLAALGPTPAFASDAEKSCRALERERILRDLVGGDPEAA